MTFAKEIEKRRTFAIISHPDAGKTTLTEKLLYFGGAIQMAGAVKARGEQRRAHSDWLKVERERGISVATSVMSFDYNDCRLNLLDTPGHEDFSEDTYRTLTAVDSAIMVLDGAKGIEGQTRKLFEVTRMRDIPVVTFINKFDREAQDPFALLDQIEQDLQLHAVPASWPIGMGRDFLGCYDLFNDQLLLMKPKASREELLEAKTQVKGIDDSKLDELLPDWAVAKLREDVEMVVEVAFSLPFSLLFTSSFKCCFNYFCSYDLCFVFIRVICILFCVCIFFSILFFLGVYAFHFKYLSVFNFYSLMFSCSSYLFS